jgi:hypothetical protein
MRSRRLLCLLLASLLLAAGVAVTAGAASRTPPPRAFRSDLGNIEIEESPSPFGLLGPRRVDAFKAALSAAGAGLLLWGALLKRAGRPRAQQRLRDGALLALGIAGALCWWNLGRFHYPHHAHRSDNYVHFLGAKYFRELGYERLYACTAVAEAEAGRGARIAERPMRRLSSNTLGTAREALDDPEACKRHFSEPRWQAFRRDVEWFRRRMPLRQWQRAQMDHGYNATPAWGVLAIPLANSGPASEGRLLALTLLDPLLLAALWAGVAWAFGWRTACVAALFWGTNPWAHFGWTGGAILRQDWLAAAILALCLLRRQRPAAAGFALASAAFLRLFPLLIFAGPGLKALAAVVRERRPVLAPAHRRLAAGALAAAALWVPLSIAAAGSDAWWAFAVNSRLHLATPLENHMGLRTALSHDRGAIAEARSRYRGADAYDPWKQARRETLASRRPLFAALVLAFAALLARAVARQPDWVAAALGVGLIPIAGELTCYYYAALLAYGLLWSEREGIGVALCALSAAGWLAASTWHDLGDLHAVSSLAVVAFVVYATARFAFGRPDAPPARSALRRPTATPE